MLIKTLKISGELAHGYVITSEGDVYNVSTGRKLKLQNTGYLHVRIPVGIDKVYKNVRIHKAMADTFLDNPLGCKVVNHIDSNKTNNKLHNLEWVTQSENVMHSIKKRKGDNYKWLVKRFQRNQRVYRNFTFGRDSKGFLQGV